MSPPKSCKQRNKKKVNRRVLGENFQKVEKYPNIIIFGPFSLLKLITCTFIAYYSGINIVFIILHSFISDRLNNSNVTRSSVWNTSVYIIINKAIRDGKYLAPPHASAWQRSPHYNRKCWYIFVTSFLCSLEFLYY